MRTIQVGKTKIFMRDEVLKHIEAPRRAVWGRAGRYLQAGARRRIARRTVALLRIHVPAVSEVRAELGRKTFEGCSAAYERLDVLSAAWEAADINPGCHFALPLATRQLGELEMEIGAMEEGLAAEGAALEQLKAALVNKGSKKDEDSIALKVAYQVAEEVAAKPPLLDTLAAAMEEALAALAEKFAELGLDPALVEAHRQKVKAAARFEKEAEAARLEEARLLKAEREAADEVEKAKAAAAAVLQTKARERAEAVAAEAKAKAEAEAAAAEELRRIDQMEAEVERQAAEREAKRRLDRLEYERQLEADPEFEVLTVELKNDLDPESSVPTPLTGYSVASTGVQFNESNAVTTIIKGSLGARDDKLRVGDVLLRIDGRQLAGDKAAEVMEEGNKPKYTLVVARHKLGPRSAPEHSGGEAEGWLLVLKAKGGEALFFERPKRQWVVLLGDSIVVHEEVRRGTRVPHATPLKGATAKTPVRGLRGQELKQPPVIQAFLQQRQFPFTLTWEAGEKDVDLVFAATTSADRSRWVKALSATLKRLKDGAPTAGWLNKQAGRRAGPKWTPWKRRWFVLTPPAAGVDATFKYWEGVPGDADAPKGMVLLNRSAQLFVSKTSKQPNTFCVTSKGAKDPKPITTVLSAATQAEMKKWMSALNEAIKASGGTVQRNATLAALHASARVTLGSTKGKQLGMSVKSVNKAGAHAVKMEALKQLEYEELKSLRPTQLKDLLEYMDVQSDVLTRKPKNKEEKAEVLEEMVRLVVNRVKLTQITTLHDY